MNSNGMAQPHQNAMYSVNPAQYRYYQQNNQQQQQHQGMLRTHATLQQQQHGQPHTTATADNHFPPQSFSQPRFTPSSPAQNSSSSQAPIRFSQAFGPVQLQQLVSRDGRQQFLVFLPITAAGHRRLVQMAASQGVQPARFISNNLRFFQGMSDGNTGPLLEHNAAHRQFQQQQQSLSANNVQRSYPGYTNGYNTAPAVNGSGAVDQYQQNLASHQHPPTQRAAGTPRWNEVAVPQPTSTPMPSNVHPTTPASPGLVPNSVDSETTSSPEVPLEKVNIDLTTSDDKAPSSLAATPVRRPAATKAIPGNMRWHAQNAARKLSSGLGKNEYATPRSGQTEEQKAREAAKVAAVAAYEKVKADSQRLAQRADGEQGLPSDANHAQTLSASIIAEAALPTPRNDSVGSNSQGSKDQEAQLGGALCASAQHSAGSSDVLPDEVRKMQGGESVKQTFNGLDKAGSALNLPWLPDTVTCVRKLQRDGRVEICLTGNLDIAQVHMDKLMGLPKAKRAAPSAGNGDTAAGEPALSKQTDGDTVAFQNGHGKKHRQKKPEGHWSNLTEEEISSRADEQAALIGRRSVVQDEGTWEGAEDGADFDLEAQLRAALASEDPSPEETADALRPDLSREVAAPSNGTTAPQHGAQQADESSPDSSTQSTELSPPQGETPSRSTFTSSPGAMASVAERKSGAYGHKEADRDLNNSVLAMGDGPDQWRIVNTQVEAARSPSILIDFETPLDDDDDDLFGEGDLTMDSAISAVGGHYGVPSPTEDGGGNGKRKRSVEDVGGLAKPPQKRNTVKRSLALPSMRAAM
ncbi:hypothetical protein KC343_g4929 [Hortaea werneckii]|nr:hypothetical protein KC352_g12667 [Hortaea werneckii]KAI7567251.1 hypothetical protein KC317_g5112 [Hortaea werneckii]KAI7619001.1 hypothetical protein KC346_g4753 [Hortaea werneckii]KAI7629954.1 hypothetical protein KC343_g4929 [Hortaea werneckii]KAI7674041.1 hypothetical protein KC319_g4907 [Hortaea werneckii]